MQFQEDKEKIDLLKKIEARLANLAPTFDDLSKDDQQALFMNALENSSLAEVVELEETNPTLIARRKAKEAAENARILDRAKRALLPV